MVEGRESTVGGQRYIGGDVDVRPRVSNERDIYCKSSAARGAINITNTIRCCLRGAYASAHLLWRKQRQQSLQRGWEKKSMCLSFVNSGIQYYICQFISYINNLT